MNPPDENSPNPATNQDEGWRNGIVLTRAEMTEWDGPLPPPEAFRSYESTLPGAAERLLTMAENWQQHQIEQERGALELTGETIAAAKAAGVGESRRAYLGIALGFIIAMTGLCGGVFLASIGRGGIGLAFGLASLVGLAAVFVYGAQSRRSGRRRNAETTGAE